MYPELHRVSTVLWVSSGGGGGADGDQGSQPDPRGVVSDHNTTPTPSPRLALPPSSALPFVGRSWMLLPFVVSFSQARTSASEHQPGAAHAPCPPCLVCLHECLPCGARLAGGLCFYCACSLPALVVGATCHPWLLCRPYGPSGTPCPEPSSCYPPVSREDLGPDRVRGVLNCVLHGLGFPEALCTACLPLPL